MDGVQLDMRLIGARIKQLRNARGISYQHLADFAGRTGRWLQDVESANPKARLTVETANALAVGLRVNVTVVLGLEPLPANLIRGSAGSDFARHREGDGVNRRDFLRSGAAFSVGGVASLMDPDALDRLAYVRKHPSRVDKDCLDQLQRTTISLQRLEGESRREALLGPVRGHLREMLLLLKEPVGVSTRNQLWTLVGETAGVAGWLVWPSDDEEATAAWFEYGLRAAARAGDKALGSYLSGCLAVQPHYRENPGLRLERLTGRLHGFSQAQAHPAIRAWLAVMEAEAYALIGRARDALTGLATAEAIMSGEGDIVRQGRPALPSSYGAFFNADYLAAEEAVVHVQLGHYEDAIQILEPLLESIEPSRKKNWYWLYPMLAQAYVDQDNVDAACRLAMNAFRGSMQMGVSTNLPLIHKVRQKLEPHRRQATVQELDEAVRQASDRAT